MNAALARLALAASLTTLLGGCLHRHTLRPARHAPAPPAPAAGQDRYADSQDSTPAAPPDLRHIPEPVPKAEPRSRYGNKSPYTVLGRTYRVLPSCAGYDERGIASWYGKKFHGYTTSNFERYDMYAYSAAHKTLPIPCYVRVTNLENGRSVVVRVNDRGPFVANRIIDLSYAAAVKIGVWPKGTAKVEVRSIDPRQSMAQTEPHGNATVPSAPRKTQKADLYLQVGAFADRANARRLADRLRAAHLGDVSVVRSRVNGSLLRRVRVGPFTSRDEAERAMRRLQHLGLAAAPLRMDN